MLSHIVAASENNVIGSHNELPWKLPNDFKYFKNKTWGMPVIMGRKSYESLKKALPGRINIVVTKKNDWKADDAIVVNNIDDAIKKGEGSDVKEIFIIGGGEIFRQTMDRISRIYITRVHANVEGDTFYPEIDSSKWHLADSHPFWADEKHYYAYKIEVLERNSGNQ